jgi:hypothetical protein
MTVDHDPVTRLREYFPGVSEFYVVAVAADEIDRLRDLVAFLRALAPSVPVGEALRQWDEQQP